MPLLVMKFGGTSVADLDRIRNAAAKVQREVIYVELDEVIYVDLDPE